METTRQKVLLTGESKVSLALQGAPARALPVEQITGCKQYASPVIFALLILLCLSLLLRTLFLGNTFQSSDNVELAFKILKNSGYSWILRESYGALINLYVKLSLGLLSFFGVTITEFWWKVPVAVVGSLQGSLTYFFLKRRIGCSQMAALVGAAFVSILPIHVFESRYLWGYEVLGVFFAILAIWKLVDFFEEPTVRTGLLASIASGLYLISHGYVIPFVPCLISIILLFAPSEKHGVFTRFKRGMELCLRRFVWVFPLVFLPLWIYPVRHALRKPTRLSFYLQDHVPGFIENTGYFLALLLLAAVMVGLCTKSIRSKFTILFTICGAAYLAPLLFGTPPGITVVRGYMLIGTYFLLLCSTVVLDKLLLTTFRSSLIVLMSACFLVTLWGTVESIFGRDQLFDPSGIKIGRGGIPPDPGSKAAGYLIRKHVKNSEKVLAIHTYIEPPNLFYYFGRLEQAYYDLSSKQAIEKFYESKDEVDVVICSVDQASTLEFDNLFDKRAVIVSENMPRMVIYARPHVEIPVVSVDAHHLNESFDREFAWRVKFR